MLFFILILPFLFLLFKILLAKDLSGWSKMWWWFNRKSPSGFSASSTAEEVTQGIDGTGLTAIVTGASGGIGSETCRVLAMRGVHVVMADINIAAGGEVKEAIVKEFPSAKVDAVYLDFSSLESVRKFATDYISTGRPLNLLINNAGIMGTPFKLSKDNIELQFATNYLGHFLMTNLLLDTMKKTSVESKREGRIVNVSSEAHRWSNWSYSEGIRFNNINDPSGYDKFKAYGQSKLAKILHANELARRLKEEGVDITANSLHPGSVLTNIARHLSVTKGVVKTVVTKLVSLVLKDTHQGAATICYVALNPQVKGVSGQYFSDSNIDKASDMGKDPELAKKLWDFSMDLVK